MQERLWIKKSFLDNLNRAEKNSFSALNNMLVITPHSKIEGLVKSAFRHKMVDVTGFYDFMNDIFM